MELHRGPVINCIKLEESRKSSIFQTLLAGENKGIEEKTSNSQQVRS